MRAATDVVRRLAWIGWLGVAAGCYPQCFGECSAPTRCGQFVDSWLQDQDARWISLEDLQRAEDLILSHAADLKDPRLMDRSIQCARLESLRVYPHHAEVWIDEWGRRVRGLAYCDAGTVMVGRAPSIVESSYPEEVLHWLQACRSSAAWRGEAPVDGSGVHANWTSDGLWQLVADVRDEWSR